MEAFRSGNALNFRAQGAAGRSLPKIENNSYTFSDASRDAIRKGLMAGNSNEVNGKGALVPYVL